MIRKAEDVRVRRVENLQGGHGPIIFYDWLIPEVEAPNHGRVISKIVIPPGSAIGVHQHTGEFEAYTLLEGEAIVTEYGEDHPFHVGDAHLCKNGEIHGIRNEGTVDVVLSAVILKDLS